MLDFFRRLFDTSDFPSRWDCGQWTDGHGWLHIISDSLVFGAYTAIPIALLTFAWKKRNEMVFHRIYLLFGAFILACGTTHLVEATIFWQPWYRLSGVLKLVTAIVSWFTVFALIRIAPEAFKLPGLSAMNERLEEALRNKTATARELERSNHDLDEFAYMASHDLKAPLRAINHLSEWIEEDSADHLPEESKRHLAQLRQRVQRMETLLNDLLDYSRAGRTMSVPETVDCAAICKQVIELVQPPAGFTVTVTEPMPVIRTLRVPLEQCLRNLISNSIKHHDRQTGSVLISCVQLDHMVEFTVEDDGPGIPPEYHERIFTMFQTLRTRDEVEASGMGLAMVRKLVDRTGGTVRVESDGTRGARFILGWPHGSALSTHEEPVLHQHSSR